MIYEVKQDVVYPKRIPNQTDNLLVDYLYSVL